MSKLEFFTEIIVVFSEKGEKRLGSIGAPEEDNDDMYNYEWFIENNITPPKDLKPNLPNSDSIIALEEDDLEHTYSCILINTSNFRDASEEEEGTLITFLDGREYLVKESLEEVYIKINYRKWKQKLLKKWVGLLSYLRSLQK